MADAADKTAWDFRFPAIDWRGQHPNLAALYERLAQRQSFKDTLPT